MAKYETDIYVGTGFTSTEPLGFIGKLDDWLLRSSGAGGAGWYTIEDGSTLIDKTFIAPTAINPINNTIAIIGHGFFTGQKVTTNYNAGGLSNVNLYFIERVDNDTVKMHSKLDEALSGTNPIGLFLTGSPATYHMYSCPYKVYSNSVAPVINDNTVKFVEIWHPYYSGYGVGNNGWGCVRFMCCLWWDTVNHIPRGLWSGSFVAVTDGGPGPYYYHFVGDTSYFMVLSSCSAVSEHRCFVFDDWTYNVAGFEDTSKIGTLASGVIAGNRVTITVGFGEASNFTVGKYYFIYDMNGHSWVDYVKVTARNLGLDTITVLNISWNFPSGSKIGSYPHRFYSSGWGYALYFAIYYTSQTNGIKVPYCSAKIKTNSSVPTEKIFSKQDGIMLSNSKLNYNIIQRYPDDKGNYQVQRITISELTDNQGSALSETKVLGILNHLYIGTNTSLIAYVDKVDIGGVDYLYAGTGDVTGVILTITDLGVFFQCEDS